MKSRLILFILSLFIVLCSKALPLDTLYYDNDWKVVSSPHFASYYRIAERDTDFSKTKRFRDYFITGELQGEGGYLVLDMYDDSKSVFSGKCTNYFKSGKIADQRTLQNGKVNGEWIIYYENGTIKTRAHFYNDQLHGLYRL